MCGLIAAFNAEGKSVNDYIINQYENQYSRGEKGFGIIRINEKGKVNIDIACEPAKFMMDLYTKKSKMMIVHHRYPTSTDNELDQTHPMVVSNPLLDFDYLVIHNGVITNDDELREKHLKFGFKYTTEYEETYGYNNTYNKIKFNDSEGIAIELALFIEGKSSAIEVDNSAAVIALQMDKKTGKALKVFFGRNTAGALRIYQNKGKIRLSSIGAGEEVKPNELHSFSINDKQFKLETQPLIFDVPKKIEEKKEIPIVQDPRKEKELLPSNIEKKETESTQRNWSKEVLAELDFSILPPNAGKEYIAETVTAFKERIKEESSTEITHSIDDALDEELDKISELITDYKNTLLAEKLTDNDLSFYSSQIFRITKAMKAITDIADHDYKEKFILEEQEFADYNVTSQFEAIGEQRKEQEKEAMMKAYESDMMGYREY